MDQTKSFPEDLNAKNMKSLKEELGYPHELLTFSSKKAEVVMKGSYRTRTKILAALYLSMQGQKVDLKVDVKNEPCLMALFYLFKRSKINVKKIAEKLNNEIEEYCKQFEETKSTSSFLTLKKFVADCIYLHSISLEMLGIPILSHKSIDLCMKYLDSEVEITSILTSFKLLEEKEKSPGEIKRVINALLPIKESPLIESALLISFLFALRFPNSKSEFLFAHYSTLRKLVETYIKIKDNQQLDDIILQRLFATSIVLFLCGYCKSLRLPHEEKLNYIEKIIKVPVIENEIEKSFDYASKVKILRFELPLWGLVITIIALLFLHAILEVYTPASINIGIISFNVPQIPIFLSFSLILLTFLFYKLLKIKEDLLKRIRKGE